MLKLRRIVLLAAVFVLLLTKFTIDVITKSVELEFGTIMIIRELAVIGAFALLYIVLAATPQQSEPKPIRRLGFLLVATVIVIMVTAVMEAYSDQRFDAKSLGLIPLEYSTIFSASLVGILFGVFALFVFRVLRDFVLYHRKRGTKRNFLLFTVLVLATAGSAVPLKPLESSVVNSILFGLGVVFAVGNSFRLPWIVYLTKREKIFSLVYVFFLFVGFTAMTVLIPQSAFVSRSLLYYSHPLREFISLAILFGNIYFGMAFVSTLFHLPTADAFDRKRSEVTSLHNLAKLITQVFDFNELADTVTSMTLRVVEAKSCWLEVVHVRESEGSRPAAYGVQIAALKNITESEIGELFGPTEGVLREAVLADRKPIVVDEVARDARFPHLRKARLSIGSLVVVPLVSHAGPLGVLYATKEAEHGFVKDDVDVISSFADQASIAIENSRLIKKSIERERFIREMVVAQEVQKRLLPQDVPRYSTLDIDAVSTPAFEVGGDYYDFVRLPGDALGIVVGDVSGKGVSAAFYMSEVKGIFQALSRLFTSPKGFMIKANEALAGSVDKRIFVSLIYAIVDVRSGLLTLSRAGHCPMLHVSADHVEYIRPNGMGMGLSGGAKFDGATEEHCIHLKEGDVCIFYTDGVTEARYDGEEFGYDRLRDLAWSTRHKPAADIKTEILETVRAFVHHEPHEDDLTLVVLKWRGSGLESQRNVTSLEAES